MFKKSTITLLCVLTVLLTLTSCLKSKPETETEESSRSPLTTIAESVTRTITTVIAETTTQKQTETKAATTVHTTKKAVTTTVAAEMPKKILEMDYYRSLLSDKGKKLYDEWLELIFAYKGFTVDFSNSDFTYDEMQNVTEAMYEDYPELRLYMRTSYEYKDTDGDDYIALSGELFTDYNWIYEKKTFSPLYMETVLNRINIVCDRIISRMPEGTYAEKYEYLAREIASMTEYYDDYDNTSEDWAYCYMNGPFLQGKGLCQAYAYAYQYLCKRAGLWCICTSGGCHCWNVVMLEDGSTYHVDITWADTWDNEFNEYYFLLTQEELEKDHTHEEKEYIIANGKSLK